MFIYVYYNPKHFQDTFPFAEQTLSITVTYTTAESLNWKKKKYIGAHERQIIERRYCIM